MVKTLVHKPFQQTVAFIRPPLDGKSLKPGSVSGFYAVQYIAPHLP
jgi:hypothetical protein